MRLINVSLWTTELIFVVGCLGWLPGEHRQILSKEGIDHFEKRDHYQYLEDGNRLLSRNLPQNISNKKNAIRGVNLGGLFIIENWLENDVFSGWGCNSTSEFDCVKSLSNQTKANTLFQEHWDTWITQDDFTKMVSYGLNTVRIPVGYWFLESIVDSSEYFPQGGASYLDRVVGWARDAGMYVIISLHGAPGAQVTNPFTGQYNLNPAFYSDYNYNRTYAWLEWMTKRVHQNAAYSTVGMLGLVNEPERLWETTKYPEAVSNAKSMRQTYYPTAWQTIRDTESSLSVASDDQLSILMMDKSWGSGDPTQYLSSDIEMAAFDRHIYASYADLTATQEAYMNFVCTETSSLNKSSSDTVIVGEWSLAVAQDIESTSSWSPQVKKVQNFYYYLWSAQVKRYETTTKGWIFWTWKTSGSLNDPRWDYQKAVAAGLIDTDIDNAYQLSICSGAPSSGLAKSVLIAEAMSMALMIIFFCV